MRIVFSNEETLHTFAQFPTREQTHGRNQNQTLSFIDTPGGEQSVLYSYTTAIACMGQQNDQTYALVTTRSYTITTTTKHMPRCNTFPDGVRVFYVDNPLASSRSFHIVNIQAYADQAEESLRKSSRARTYKTSHEENAQRLTIDGLAYAEFFGYGEEARKILHLDMLSEEGIEAVREEIKKADKIKRAEELKQAKKKREEEKEKLEAWRAGEEYNCPASYTRIGDPRGGDKLRIHTLYDGPVVQTSAGVTISIEDAHSLLRLSRATAKTGKTYTPEGVHRIGQYSLNHITHKGDIRAGCHLVMVEEIERIADSVEELVAGLVSA